MYGSVTELPDNIQADCTPDEQAEYLRVFNAVFQQTNAADKSAAAAWGAVKKMRLLGVSVMRAARNGDPIIGGWAMKFVPRGSDDKDSYETYFTRASRLLLEYYASAPLWMEHGQDKDFLDEPIGKRVHAEVYGHGVWLDHALHRNHPRFEETFKGVEEGEFCYSSDSIGHYVDIGFNPVDGRLGSWPFAGCSLTTAPAEVSLGPVAFRAFFDALQSATEYQQSDSEAREARRLGERKTFVFPSVKEGEDSMTPEMMAALAEFLDVEATPEAVSDALQDLLGQLQGGGAEQEAMATQLAPALGLSESAGRSEVIGKLEAIQAMLADADDDENPSGRSLNVAALKRFNGLAVDLLDEPEDDPIPYFVGDNADEEEEQQQQRRSSRSQRYAGRGKQNGRAKKPGLVDFLRSIHPNRDIARTSPMRATSYQIGPANGYILEHQVSDQFLPVLRDALPLYDMGVQEYTMDGVESLTIPKDKTEHEAYWVGEGAEIPESDETTGGVILFPRPLAARVRVPNKFLTNSRVDYESRVNEKVIYRINRAIMRAALYGTGGVSGANVGAQPLGLKTLAGLSGRAVTLTTLGSGNGDKPKIKDLTDAMGRVEDAKVELDNGASILFSPRTRRHFADMTDKAGQPLLRGSWAVREERDIAGFPWDVTTAIDNTETIGSSTDCSTIFAGVWEWMALGLSNQFEFLVDPYSRASFLETVIMVWTYADVAVLYDEAFEVIDGVRS